MYTIAVSNESAIRTFNSGRNDVMWLFTLGTNHVTQAYQEEEQEEKQVISRGIVDWCESAK
jgi:hypothetical protein